MSSEPGASYYAAFVALCVVTLKAVNEEVTEPYMVSVAHERCLISALTEATCRTGRAVSRPAGAGVLQGGLLGLGPKDYNPTRSVSGP